MSVNFSDIRNVLEFMKVTERFSGDSYMIGRLEYGFRLTSIETDIIQKIIENLREYVRIVDELKRAEE